MAANSRYFTWGRIYGANSVRINKISLELSKQIGPQHNATR